MVLHFVMPSTEASMEFHMEMEARAAVSPHQETEEYIYSV